MSTTGSKFVDKSPQSLLKSNRCVTLGASKISNNQTKQFANDGLTKTLESSNNSKVPYLKKVVPFKMSSSGFNLLKEIKDKNNSHVKCKDSSLNSSQISYNGYKSRNQNKILKPTLPKIVGWQHRTTNGFYTERKENETLFITPDK